MEGTTPSLNSGTPLPALKAGVEAVEIEHEGRPMVLLRDQEGINDQSIAVSLPGFLVATLLNGKNSIADIQSHFVKTTGSILKPEEVQSMVAQLDKSDLLETERLRTKRRQVLDDFLSNPIRKAALEGAAYPSEPLELAAYIGKFFKAPKGPGKEVPATPLEAEPPFGLVSPHIDLERGGPAYAWAYQALAECPPPDVIVALGVAHLSPNSPWVLTRKSYETPYGPLPVDNELAGQIQKVLWYDARADEWAHRREHSLEFQALWLKYLWRDKTPAWVPLLCSTFERFCPDRAPSTVPTIEKAINDIGNLLAATEASGKRVMILAGVDLAHVGPRFGDEEKLGTELEQRVEKEDRVSLDHALRCEADAFYLSVVADGHWRKVCGLSALYTSLRLIKMLAGARAPRAALLTYGQAPDPLGGLVSFTSAIYKR